MKDTYTVHVDGYIVGQGLTLEEAIQLCEFSLQTTTDEITINIDREKKA